MGRCDFLGPFYKFGKKALLGKVMQCGFDGCPYLDQFNKTGDCPGDPYTNKCKKGERYV